MEFNPGLEAKTLFAELQRRCPGTYNDGQLRTLQRNFKDGRSGTGGFLRAGARAGAEVIAQTGQSIPRSRRATESDAPGTM